MHGCWMLNPALDSEEVLAVLVAPDGLIVDERRFASYIDAHRFIQAEDEAAHERRETTHSDGGDLDRP